MLRAGVPVPMVESMLGTLQELRHYVRTAYGESVEFFDSFDGSKPIGGVGQGNGAAPGIWALVSTPIFDSLRRRGYGVYSRGALSGDTFQFVGYAFVDDSDIIVTDNPDQPQSPSIHTVLQNAVNLWDDSLTASGGALVPAKSHWYLIDFHWENGKWNMIYPDPADPVLTIKDHHGIRGPIQRIPPNKGIRTLGIRIAPDGNNTDELEYLRSKAKVWKEKIRDGTLPRHLVWESMTTGIFNTLSYPLIATTFTKEECNSIIGPVLWEGLPKAGIVRSISRAIVYGPIDRGGLGLPNLFYLQLQRHIERLMRYGHISDHTTGFLDRCSLEQTTLELGLPGHPFDHSFAAWQRNMTKTWLTRTWEDMQTVCISLHPNTPTIPLLRDGDSFLMSRFYDSGIRSPDTLLLLNETRMFLNAVTLADIVTADGKSIQLTGWSGSLACGRRQLYDWPRCAPPSSRHIQHWQAALISTFGIDHRHHNLPVPLGKWTSDSFQAQWLYSSLTDRLLLQNNDGMWLVFPRVPSPARRPKFSSSQVLSGGLSVYLSHLPLCVADVQLFHSQFVMTNQSAQPIRTVPLIIPTFPFTLASLNLGWLSSVWFLPPSQEIMEQLCTSILLGTCAAHSDGSFLPDSSQGSCAWGLSHSESVPFTLAAGAIVPGPSSGHSSYRSELTGILGIVTALRFLVKFCHIQAGSVTIACDNLSAVKRIFNRTTLASPKDNSWDLVSLIQLELRGMPQISFHWRHVDSHQDRHKSMVDLDIWEQRNVIADVWCDDVWNHGLPTLPHLPDSRSSWRLSIQGLCIVSKFKTRFEDATTGRDMEQYLHSKEKLGQYSSVPISWSALGDAIVSLPTSRRHWWVKQTTGNCAVGTVMLRRKEWTHSRCPRCSTDKETPAHVLQCNTPETAGIWSAAILELYNSLVQLQTHPDVIAIICGRLLQWRSQIPLSPFTTNLRGLQAVLMEQDNIGWQSAAEGRWSKKWEEVMTGYYASRLSRRTGRRWLSEIIKKLMNVSWDMWENRNGAAVRVREEERRLANMGLITAEFALGWSSLTRYDKKLFTNNTLTYVLAKRPDEQDTWLKRVTGARRRASSTVGQSDLLGRQQMMRAFFSMPI